MRIAVLFLLVVGALAAQFKSTVPLVIAPTTVIDAKGRLIDGLTDQDLVFYDHNVRQPIQVDWEIHPISLVVLVEAGNSATPIIDKIHRIGSLLSALLAGEAGETAVLAFSDNVRMVQDFTGDSTPLTKSVRNLRVRGDGCAVIDGLAEALRLLDTRGPRRRVILVIGERRDRSSQMPLERLMHADGLQNTLIYWLTYSNFLAPFTSRPKTVWDRMTDEEKERPERMQPGLKTPLPEEKEPLPPDYTPGSLINIFTELIHRSAVDAAELLARTTGGRTFSFSRQNALEQAVQAVAEEVHQQYLVSFQPKPDEPGVFHTIHAEVKGRPDLQVRTRSGYWTVR